MKIILNNNIILNPILATGESAYIQGANRDMLTFVFPETEDMIYLDTVFSSANCVSIMVEDDNGDQYIHNGYTIRAGLEKKPIEVAVATETEPAIMENRIFVKMAQRTYTENQIASLTETVDYLVMESLMA